MPPSYIVRCRTEDCVDEVTKGLCALAFDVAELQHQAERVQRQKVRH